MNWGVKITIAFLIFAAIMAVMVVISVKQDINLVADDYYKQEIEYETQIDRIKNIRTLQDPPRMLFNASDQEVIILFVPAQAGKVSSGEVHLYRPSDRYKDVKATLVLNDLHEMAISMKGRIKGKWIVKLNWTDGPKEYYDEFQFVY